ncbi:MAG: hypothetical protein COA97_08150 [Flavobacteriales bacterium]|nr:MAG: hypothetical protein COA97_08150 [Flavobacteriales bacterium]
MKTKFLLPNKFKKVGWVLMIPAAIIGTYFLFVNPDFEPDFLKLPVLVLYMQGTPFNEGTSFFSIISTNISNELAGIFFLVSAMMVAFSKAKNEDEYITKIRLESLVWATYVNYAILLFGMLFVFGLEFLTFMIFNMFTLLILFIFKFNFALYKSKRL